MTEEKAIKWLKAIEKKYIHGGDEGFDEARREAIGMAIAALEAQREAERKRAAYPMTNADCIAKVLNWLRQPAEENR